MPLSTRSATAALAIAAGLAITSAAEAQVRALGIDTASFDRSVRPQDDFFRFVNGGWIAKTAIPADASSWGSFNELRERSRDALHEILEEAAKAKAPAGSVKQKVGDAYAAYLDSARIESLGITPLSAELKAIASLTDVKQLPSTFAHFARIGVGNVFSVGVGQDPKESNVNIVQVGQSGIGLPDRDYYLKDDASSKAIRDAYVTYITDVFTAAKQQDPAGAAARILALETAIAKNHWDRVKSRNRDLSYNKMSVADLAALSPAYDWKSFLAASGLGAAKDVIVRQPDYVKNVNEVIASTPASTWREYLTLRLLDTYGGQLPSAFSNARFAFRGKTLSGQQEQSARWKRAVSETEGLLGEATGELYVAKNFKPEAKARMQQLVKNLLDAYRIGIDSLEWMSPETKKQAQDKLAHFTVKIGYPDKWRDYSKLTIKRDDALGNAMRARTFVYSEMISQLGKPVDRARWGMTPQTVNAYYNPSNNEIVFPAAILQYPFFDPNRDDAANYGAIGAVIGHEIGHGFDDQGRKSDGAGNLRDWWTPADAQGFEARTTKLGAQYDALEALPGLHVNGKLTMGENIGDVSGLQQAYRAYKLSLGGKEAPVIGGFTGDQRFFLGFAQVWRGKYRDPALRQQVLTNPHSPDMFRAFVPLTDNDAFMKAFDVKPGDRMWREPADRVKIW